LRHIAWDIGAADVARDLAQRLDAPLVLAGASRLLIDLNRPLGCASSIPQISEATVIPGNIDLDEAERHRRIQTWFDPFQAAVAGLIDRRLAAGQPTRIVAVHSFTPVYLGVKRPWDAGVLYRRAQRFGAELVDRLGGKAARIAHNQPYQIEDESDFTVPQHGEARGLDAVLVELRQDLVGSDSGARDWALRLARSLSEMA
jgi:predicted N-formylglutamate amidohydrolase